MIFVVLPKTWSCCFFLDVFHPKISFLKFSYIKINQIKTTKNTKKYKDLLTITEALILSRHFRKSQMTRSRAWSGSWTRSGASCPAPSASSAPPPRTPPARWRAWRTPWRIYKYVYREILEHVQSVPQKEGNPCSNWHISYPIKSIRLENIRCTNWVWKIKSITVMIQCMGDILK